VKAGSVEPDLRVLECLNHTVPSKLFVLNGVAIFFEPCDNMLPFLGSQESGGRGIVVDEEVCKTGEDNGKKSLLLRYVSYCMKSRSIKFTMMKIHLHPLRPAMPLILAMANA
jgi:hypothetical protein